MNTDNVRADQIREGHSRTLHAKPGHNPNRPGKRPFVAKGHDAILKEVQDSDGYLEIVRMSDAEPIVGRLVARDKFTITILTDAGSRRTFYKHAIESFEPVKVQ